MKPSQRFRNVIGRANGFDAALLPPHPPFIEKKSLSPFFIGRQRKENRRYPPPPPPPYCLIQGFSSGANAGASPIFLSQLNPFQTFSGILPRRGLRSLVNPSIFASDMQSGEINLPSYGGEGGGGGEGGQIADLAPLSWMHHGKLSFC